MKRLPLPPLMAGFMVVLLAAAPLPSPEALLEQGNAAMEAGDFTRAIELYEKAEPRADDPGRVTFNLALAKFQRAVKDDSVSDLEEAEQLFRCLLDPNEPRRAQALFGIGNCELQKAGERDADSALTAIEAYEQCLQAAEDKQLVADAQHNLERARLLLHQIRKAEDERKPPEADPANGSDQNPKSPKPKPEPKSDPSRDPKNPGARQKPDGPVEPIKRDSSDKPMETSEPPPPGSGPLRPVPDQADQPPLSEKEAREHLKLANEHIWRERHQHRLGLAKPPAEDVRDW
jgi:tetratricopeptide (TPR) repeat protein